MKTKRIRMVAVALAVGAAAACDGSSTFLGESDGGLGPELDTFWSVPLDGGPDAEPDAGPEAAAWRESTDPWAPPPVPYCEAQWDPMPFDLWADDSGIYVLTAWERIRPADGGWFVGEPPVLQISYNGGLGWTEFFRDSCEQFGGGSWGCLTRIGGVLEGRLLGWGSAGSVYGFEPGMVEPMWSGELYNIGSLFVVDDHLAYAMWQAGPDSRVVHYDGAGWAPVPVALPFESAAWGRIWADEEDVFVAGGSAVLLSLEGDEWRIHDPGTLGELTAIWGFAGDDVWIGTYDGQLRHFDGTTWADVEWPDLDDGTMCNEGKPILAMWGSDGVLYFITETHFVRWDGTRFDVLGHWPLRYDDTPGVYQCVGDGIRPVALRGNSPTEVFLLVTRQVPRLGAYCEGSAVLWWDGTTLRQI